MLPYILLITIPAVWLFVEKYRTTGSLRGALSVDTPSSNRSLMVFFVLFLALLCLRDIYVGCDLINYRRMYYYAGGWDKVQFDQMVAQELQQRGIFAGDYQESNLQSSGTMTMETDGFEPIFKLLYGILAKTIFSFRLFLIVCALLSVVPVALFYVKKSNLPLLTISLFVAVAPFTFYFSGLRQTIAMGFMIPLYYYARDKKYIKFLVCFAIAIGFHYSAVVALALFPLLHLKITRKWMIGIGPILIALFIWNRPFLQLVLSLAGRYGEKYAKLVDTGAYGMLTLFAIFVVYSFVIPQEEKMTQEDFGLRNILLFILAIQIFAPLHSQFMRLGYYFHIFIPIIIPRMAMLANSKQRWLAKLSVYVMEFFFLCDFIINGYTSADILQVFPYIPFWGSSI